MYITLAEETLNILNKHGKSEKDIKWIGCKKFTIPIDEFWKQAQKRYDDSYGIIEVMPDLIIVGEDFWLERAEYDGAEWWEYKEFPQMPKMIIPNAISIFTNYHDHYLEDFVI